MLKLVSSKKLPNFSPTKTIRPLLTSFTLRGQTLHAARASIARLSAQLSAQQSKRPSVRSWGNTLSSNHTEQPAPAGMQMVLARTFCTLQPLPTFHYLHLPAKASASALTSHTDSEVRAHTQSPRPKGVVICVQCGLDVDVRAIALAIAFVAICFNTGRNVRVLHNHNNRARSSKKTQNRQGKRWQDRTGISIGPSGSTLDIHALARAMQRSLGLRKSVRSLRLQCLQKRFQNLQRTKNL